MAARVSQGPAPHAGAGCSDGSAGRCTAHDSRATQCCAPSTFQTPCRAAAEEARRRYELLSTPAGSRSNAADRFLDAVHLVQARALRAQPPCGTSMLPRPCVTLECHAVRAERGVGVKSWAKSMARCSHCCAPPLLALLPYGGPAVTSPTPTWPGLSLLSHLHALLATAGHPHLLCGPRHVQTEGGWLLSGLVTAALSLTSTPACSPARRSPHCPCTLASLNSNTGPPAQGCRDQEGGEEVEAGGVHLHAALQGERGQGPGGHP